MDILETMKSLHEVSLAGIKSGQEIAFQKYKPLLQKAYEFVLKSDNYNDGGEPANRLAQELHIAINEGN